MFGAELFHASASERVNLPSSFISQFSRRYSLKFASGISNSVSKVSTFMGFTFERVIVSGAEVFFSVVAAEVTISTVIPLLKVTGGMAIQKSVDDVAFIVVLLHSNVMLFPASELNLMVDSPLDEQLTVASPLSFSLLLPLITICLIDPISYAFFNCNLRNPNRFLNSKS